MIHPLHSVITAFFRPIRWSLDDQLLLDKFAKLAAQARFVESLAPAGEYLDRFPERALKVHRFELNA